MRVGKNESQVANREPQVANSGSANMPQPGRVLAGSTGLEPAASGVTGRRSNQLNYDPDLNW
jgi:hypothetical protein